MSAREVIFIISKGGHIIYSDASDTPLLLPDSRTRWNAIWENREQLSIIAHSHPPGLAAFSDEDTSTMKAIEDALGRKPLGVVVVPQVTSGEPIAETTWWVDLLKLASGLQVGFRFRSKREQRASSFTPPLKPQGGNLWSTKISRATGERRPPLQTRSYLPWHSSSHSTPRSACSLRQSTQQPSRESAGDS